jgi:hypothetical protein
MPTVDAEPVASAKYPRHVLEAPGLTMEERFAPLGFPVLLRTNSAQVLDLYRAAWGRFPLRYPGDPIRIDIHVIASDEEVCPPAPNFRMTFPLMQSIADRDNYGIHDLERGTTQIVLSTAAMRHPLYASYFFIEAAAACHITGRLSTPLHAGCVEWAGQGILLCGESGAGKSTLSFACAHHGFGYLSDDATFLLRDPRRRTVTGNSYNVRLRPESAVFFPGMAGKELTPRAAGKPSVEFPLPSNMKRLDEVFVHHIVFLNRRSMRRGLHPYPKEEARPFFQNMVFGLEEHMRDHFDAIEHLLHAQLHELHYTNLDDAVKMLQDLASSQGTADTPKR